MQPSPVITATRRPGKAHCTPTAAGIAQPIGPRLVAEIGARLKGAPVVAGEGAVRAGIDEQNAIAREGRAQRRHRRRGMDRPGRPAAVLDVEEPRPRLDGADPGAALSHPLRKRRRRRPFRAAEQLQESPRAAGNDMSGLALGGQLLHVHVDLHGLSVEAVGTFVLLDHSLPPGQSTE